MESGRKYFAIDGTCCTTKTTILNKIKNNFNRKVKIHLNDFAEFMSVNKFGFFPAANSILFTSWRINETKTYEKDLIHICDREPLAGYIYQLIFSEATLEEIEDHFIKCKKLNLNNDWSSFIIVVKEGAEEYSLQKMISRANGLDLMEIEYIKRQNDVFRIWAKVMDYPLYEVDFSDDIDSDQNNIIDLISSAIKTETEIKNS